MYLRETHFLCPAYLVIHFKKTISKTHSDLGCFNMHDDGARFEINWLLLRQRSHYAREFWKHSFIFTVRPTVHTSRHENGAFRKRSSNRKNLKTAAFGLIRRKKKNVLKTELSENGVTIITWFPWSSFHQTQIQNDRWLLRFVIPPVESVRKTFHAYVCIRKPPSSNSSAVA